MIFEGQPKSTWAGDAHFSQLCGHDQLSTARCRILAFIRKWCIITLNSVKTPNSPLLLPGELLQHISIPLISKVLARTYFSLKNKQKNAKNAIQLRRASKRSQDLLEESVQFPTSFLTAFLNWCAQTAQHCAVFQQHWSQLALRHGRCKRDSGGTEPFSWNSVPVVSEKNTNKHVNSC